MPKRTIHKAIIALAKDFCTKMVEKFSFVSNMMELWIERSTLWAIQ
jgi:hypothetical protein